MRFRTLEGGRSASSTQSAESRRLFRSAVEELAQSLQVEDNYGAGRDGASGLHGAARSSSCKKGIWAAVLQYKHEVEATAAGGAVCRLDSAVETFRGVRAVLSLIVAVALAAVVIWRL